MRRCDKCLKSLTKEKLTTSKAALRYGLIVCSVWMTWIIIVWTVFDRADAAGMLGAVAAIAAVIFGFYEWKAKAENLAKYGKKDDIHMN